MTEMNVILGAGGAIASEVAGELLRRGQNVRLVSRRGVAMAHAESVQADLLDRSRVLELIPQDAVVYLLAGLAYDVRVWRAQWPRLMENVLEACVNRGARMVFFDNVYMYGAVDGVMTEETPIRPASGKGEVRARTATMLLEAAGSGRVKACIARSADFYGPNAQNSIIDQAVLRPLSKGKPAQWLADADVPHSFTYTPDCGRAIPMLAAAEDSWGQVWHLPTAAPPLTGRELVALAAQALGVPPRIKVLSPWMLRLAGLFNRTVHELVEMLYQNDRPYIFDSSKFERRFRFTPTPYSRGIEETMRALRA